MYFFFFIYWGYRELTFIFYVEGLRLGYQWVLLYRVAKVSVASQQLTTKLQFWEISELLEKEN